MNIAGIICEYNPLHNGHVHHISATKKACGADYVVCVMSGSFVQRGEPAIIDKWTRTRMALLCGADLVLELPALYALRSAQDFALGGVGILDSLGCVTHLSFGSEYPLEALRTAMTEEHCAGIRDALAKGESFPRAVGQMGGVLAHPNATLGVEYLRAIDRLQSPITPLIIERRHPHDAPQLHSMASASAIRKATLEGDSPAHAMPDECFSLYEQALHGQNGPAMVEPLFRMLLNAIRNVEPGSLDHLPGAAEGLGRRLWRAAQSAQSYDDLLHNVKCKRYTMARIRRLAMHALLQTPKELSLAPIEPSYARVLGFRKQAQPLLRQIDRYGKIPITTKLPSSVQDPCLALDIRAQNIWALACPLPRTHNQDFSSSMVMLSI